MRGCSPSVIAVERPAPVGLPTVERSFPHAEEEDFIKLIKE
jgi:hypothetical protein